MQKIVHNQLSDTDFGKVASTIDYYSEKHLEKHDSSNRWKLEAWCNEGDGKEQKNISCGISLKRPGLSEIYVKKDAEDFKSAAHSCVLSIEKVLRRKS